MTTSFLLAQAFAQTPASLWIYGVISYSVNQRTQEIGIGASAEDL